jgi:hypothetical protein
MPKIVIEKPLKGWITNPENTAGASGVPTVAHEGAEGQYTYSNSISLFRLDRLGHIAPGETFSALSDSGNYIDDLPLNIEVASTGKPFAVLKNGKLVRIASALNTTEASFAPTLGAPNHSGHTINASNNNDFDVLVVKGADASSTEYVLWSWYDGTDGDISLIAPASSSVDNDDWFSTLTSSAVLTKGVPLKMIQGPDGNIYITNGQYIASAVMTSGQAVTAATGNTAALNFGAGYVATTITNQQNFIVAGGYKATTYISGVARSSCRVWFWDGYSPEPNSIYDIPDNYLSALFNDNGTLYAITYGKGSTTKLWVFTGGGFEHVFETQAAAIVGKPLDGAIESFQKSLLVAADTKKIFQIYNNSFHHRATVYDGTNTATDIGAIKNVGGTTLFVGATISGPAYKIYSMGYSNSFTNAVWRSRLYRLPYRSTVKKITVYFSQFAASSSLTVKLFDNYTANTGTARYTKQITTTAHPKVATYLDAQLFPNEKNLNAFYLELTFDHSAVTDTAAIVRSIEVEYEVLDHKT